MKFKSVDEISNAMGKMQYPRSTFSVNDKVRGKMNFISYSGISSRMHGNKVAQLIIDCIDINSENGKENILTRMRTIRHPKVRNAFLYDGFVYIAIIDKMIPADIVELVSAFKNNSLDTTITRLGQKYLFPVIVGDSNGIHMHMCVDGTVESYDRLKLPVYNPKVKRHIAFT